MSQLMYGGVAVSPLTTGERIGAALSESGLTPTEVARALVGDDADQSRVANMRRLLRKWIDDQHRPTPANLRRLGEIFARPESYFTDGQTTASPVPVEVEKEALALVWETAVNVESNGGRIARPPSKGIPPKFGRRFIARELAPSFTEEHILLDEVIEWEAGVAAVATAHFESDTWGLGHWYKDATLIPGLLIVEALTQTASVALLTSEKHRGRIILCARYDGVRLRKPVQSEEKLVFHAKARHLSGPIAHFDAWATRERSGERVANGLFTIAVH